MKTLKLVLMLIAFTSSGMVISSCGGTSNDASEMNEKSKEYASAYVCPMHCKGSGSEKPGKCPACKMDYVKNDDHEKDGHDHSKEKKGHEGHNHGDHDGHNH